MKHAEVEPIIDQLLTQMQQIGLIKEHIIIPSTSGFSVSVRMEDGYVYRVMPIRFDTEL